MKKRMWEIIFFVMSINSLVVYFFVKNMSLTFIKPEVFLFSFIAFAIIGCVIYCVKYFNKINNIMVRPNGAQCVEDLFDIMLLCKKRGFATILIAMSVKEKMGEIAISDSGENNLPVRIFGEEDFDDYKKAAYKSTQIENKKYWPEGVQKISVMSTKENDINGFVITLF